MDVGAVQNPAVNVTAAGQKAGTPQPAAPEVKVSTPVETVQNAQETASKTDAKMGGKDEQDPEQERKTVENTVKQLNGFMELMTADLHFLIHEKTQRLMVQLISEKDHKVLREYPSKEFLDMIANIREHIGVLTDRKA